MFALGRVVGYGVGRALQGKRLMAVVFRWQDLPKRVAVTEVSPDTIRQLMSLSKEIYFPLLTHPGNQDGWPDVIAKELTENLHKFLANTYVTMGHMEGETLLPLPPDDVYSSMEKNQHDKDSVHVLETAVVAWTRQIKDVLRLDPETVLKGGGHPGPMAEVDFWQNKAKNLNSIHEQLSSDKVRKLFFFLTLVTGPGSSWSLVVQESMSLRYEPALVTTGAKGDLKPETRNPKPGIRNPKP